MTNAFSHVRGGVTSRAISTTLAIAAACLLAGCGGTGANKSGASDSDPVNLRLAMPDDGDTLGELFVENVVKRSGGSIRIQVITGDYSNRLPANEAKLARALQQGLVDIGYLPTRAWAVEGLPAFKALLAPFVITSDLAAQDLASSPAAQQLLKTLPGSVVGVGLVPVESRRILATRAPLTPAAFAHLRIRIIDNPQSAAAFRALGAVPVVGLDAPQVLTALRGHELDAVESAPGWILANAYFNVARYLSAYAIFPKFESIVLSRRAWNRLSGDQQAAIRTAADETRAAAASQTAEQEAADLTQLCQAHVHVVTPSPLQLEALRRATQRTVSMLAADATAASVLASMRAAQEEHPDRVASALPPACRSTATPERGSATIPNGVYVVTDTAADFRARGLVSPDFNEDITYVTQMSNGRFYQTQKPNFPDQGPFNGTYEIHGDEVVFTTLKTGVNGENAVTAPETLKWSFYRGELRFRIVAVADPAGVVLYTAHPWRKVR
jgi:TRAP-type C4-dicarboxylate transport system substrate-binding protein